MFQPNSMGYLSVLCISRKLGLTESTYPIYIVLRGLEAVMSITVIRRVPSQGTSKAGDAFPEHASKRGVDTLSLSRSYVVAFLFLKGNSLPPTLSNHSRYFFQDTGYLTDSNPAYTSIESSDELLRCSIPT